MDKEYFLQELTSHIKYMDEAGRESDATSEEIEKLTSSIISKKESGEKLSLDDFVEMEKLSFKVNVIQLDLTRIASRIRLLYQLGEGEGFDVEAMLPVEQRVILKSIVELGGDFSLMRSGDRMDYKDPDLKAVIEDSCKNRVKEQDLDARYLALKSQYEKYKETIQNVREAEEANK